MKEKMIENVIKGKVADIAGEDAAKSTQVGKAAEKIADVIMDKTGGKPKVPEGAAKSATEGTAGSAGGLAGQIQGFMGQGEVKTDSSKKDGGLADKLGGFLNK